jgi:hypothetical protein
MYSDEDTVTIELTEDEWATAFYALNRELERQIEHFDHERSGRKRIREIEDMMESFREQAMSQGMEDPANNR